MFLVTRALSQCNLTCLIWSKSFIPITILSDFVPGRVKLEVDSLCYVDIRVGERVSEAVGD